MSRWLLLLCCCIQGLAPASTRMLRLLHARCFMHGASACGSRLQKQNEHAAWVNFETERMCSQLSCYDHRPRPGSLCCKVNMLGFAFDVEHAHDAGSAVRQRHDPSDVHQLSLNFAVALPLGGARALQLSGAGSNTVVSLPAVLVAHPHAQTYSGSTGQNSLDLVRLHAHTKPCTKPAAGSALQPALAWAAAPQQNMHRRK